MRAGMGTERIGLNSMYINERVADPDTTGFCDDPMDFVDGVISETAKKIDRASAKVYVWGRPWRPPEGATGPARCRGLELAGGAGGGRKKGASQAIGRAHRSGHGLPVRGADQSLGRWAWDWLGNLIAGSRGAPRGSSAAGRPPPAASAERRPAHARHGRGGAVRRHDCPPRWAVCRLRSPPLAPGRVARPGGSAGCCRRRTLRSTICGRPREGGPRGFSTINGRRRGGGPRRTLAQLVAARSLRAMWARVVGWVVRGAGSLSLRTPRCRWAG